MLLISYNVLLLVLLIHFNIFKYLVTDFKSPLLKQTHKNVLFMSLTQK